MAGAVGTQARWTISSSQGNKRLKRVASYDIEDGSSSEAVNAVGEDSPIGVIDKPGAKTISFEVYEEQGSPEVDYEDLKSSKEWFQLQKEIVGGREFQYPECRVSSIKASGDKDGKHMFTVDIIALRELPL